EIGGDLQARDEVFRDDEVERRLVNHLVALELGRHRAASCASNRAKGSRVIPVTGATLARLGRMRCTGTIASTCFEAYSRRKRRFAICISARSGCQSSSTRSALRSAFRAFCLAFIVMAPWGSEVGGCGTRTSSRRSRGAGASCTLGSSPSTG